MTAARSYVAPPRNFTERNSTYRLSDWLWYWETNYGAVSKDATQQSDRSRLQTIVNIIGDTPLCGPDLAGAVQRLIMELRGKQSPASIKNVWGVLKRALEKAASADFDLIDRVPQPALPRRVRSKQDFFTVEQMRELAEERLFYAVAAETGLRLGELRGLRPVDFTRMPGGYVLLTLRESVYGSKRQTPKTPSAERTISISTALAQRLNAAFTGRSQTGYLFSPDGKRPPSASLTTNWLHKSLKDRAMVIQPNNATQCGYHAFRRGVATLMAVLKIDPTIQIYRLGHDPHAQGVITMIYPQVVIGSDREAAELIGAQLFAKTTEAGS